MTENTAFLFYSKVSERVFSSPTPILLLFVDYALLLHLLRSLPQLEPSTTDFHLEGLMRQPGQAKGPSLGPELDRLPCPDGSRKGERRNAPVEDNSMFSTLLSTRGPALAPVGFK